ncbi:MAG: polyketide biosynthesis methyltransferase [Salinibacterium sp.]|nr:polyketide biosynthesis methyltransferase [Salinibacterium sp.]
MTSTPHDGASPHRILDIATGYMAAKQLFAASRVGMFAALAGGPLGVDQLASRIGITPRMTRILADSLNGIGLLERTAGMYTLAPDAAAYLAGADSDLDLTPFLAFLGGISFPHWTQYFDGTVDTTEPGTLDISGDRMDIFMGGVMTYNALHAKMLARTFDFSPFADMLDLGGLSSAFAVEAMMANPGLRTTFVFDPEMLGFVTGHLAASGMDARSTVVGAETVTAQPEGNYDLVMLNHVIHRFTADENVLILTHARAAAAEGATLLLLDFFLDDDERQRSIDAVHAGEYLVIDGTVVWPQSEVNEWLAASGWLPVETLALEGSPRVIVAHAI